MPLLWLQSVYDVYIHSYRLPNLELDSNFGNKDINKLEISQIFIFKI